MERICKYNGESVDHILASFQKCICILNLLLLNAYFYGSNKKYVKPNSSGIYLYL